MHARTQREWGRYLRDATLKMCRQDRMNVNVNMKESLLKTKPKC